jgi:hypothetical protein
VQQNFFELLSNEPLKAQFDSQLAIIDSLVRTVKMIYDTTSDETCRSYAAAALKI